MRTHSEKIPKVILRRWRLLRYKNGSDSVNNYQLTKTVLGDLMRDVAYNSCSCDVNKHLPIWIRPLAPINSCEVVLSQHIWWRCSWAVTYLIRAQFVQSHRPVQAFRFLFLHFASLMLSGMPSSSKTYEISINKTFRINPGNDDALTVESFSLKQSGCELIANVPTAPRTVNG